jgi:hypothetical protein
MFPALPELLEYSASVYARVPCSSGAKSSKWQDVVTAIIQNRVPKISHIGYEGFGTWRAKDSAVRKVGNTPPFVVGPVDIRSVIHQICQDGLASLNICPFLKASPTLEGQKGLA